MGTSVGTGTVTVMGTSVGTGTVTVMGTSVGTGTDTVMGTSVRVRIQVEPTVVVGPDTRVMGRKLGPMGPMCNRVMAQTLCLNL